MSEQTAWHTLSEPETLERLGSPISGLDEEEAARRLSETGPNELEPARRPSAWSILASQFANVLIVILLIATVLSFFLGHQTEAIAITAIVLLAVLLGFVQEYRAERALEALQEMAAPAATVVRGGRERRIRASELVPGDRVLLHAGDRIPADLRLTESVLLRADESLLTGESVPVDKSEEPVADAAAPVADRTCMVFAGTTVAHGRGTGVVVATGMETEFGRIAGLLKSVEQVRTPLQIELDRVGAVLARAALAVVAVVVAMGLLRGQPFFDMLLFGVALAVAVVPEALPAVVTISLALGVKRMVKRNALGRRLPAVETLGSTTVICTDKTGTLTRNEMTVRSIHLAEVAYTVGGIGYAPEGAFEKDGAPVEPPDDLVALLEAAVLASDARLVQEEDSSEWRILGDPTEGALVVAAAKAGLVRDTLEENQPRIAEIPFTSERKRMTTLHRTAEGPVAYTKGAPEAVLGNCTRALANGEERPLAAGERERFLAEASELAGRGMRLLAVAHKRGAKLEDAEAETTFLGLTAMLDPARAEAPRAVEECRDAHIQVVMITGDHPLTAGAIAREIGILESGKTMTGADLDGLDEPDLRRAVAETEVYARVSPAHKLRIVEAFQAEGQVAAMTGDGVNDAPALRRADIGVAMGRTGTDVTREAADMTLLDDNFATIVAAVEEGRGIFSNIKKYLMYLLSSNVGEILLVAGAGVLGWPMPLTAVQILYVNLATDGLPALALALDPPESDLMQQPPRDRRRGIFQRSTVLLMSAGGVWSGIVNLSVFAWALGAGHPLEHAMTLTFISLVLIQFFKAYNFRSDHRSVLERPFANRWLNLAILWEILLLVLIVEWEPLERIFGTTPVTVQEWLALIAVASTVSIVLEIVKAWQRRSL